MSSNRTFTGILLGVVLAASACSSSDGPTGVSTPLPTSANATTLTDEQAAYAQLSLQLDSVLAAQKVKVAAGQVEGSSLLGALLGTVKKLSTNGVQFLTCKALPYSADADIIGPNGGTLQMGPHKLVIPKGALVRHTLIIGEAPLGVVAEVQFAPHGLRFQKSATLTLSYRHCLLPLQSLLPVLFRNVFVENGRVVEFLPTKMARDLKATISPLDHFSSYMIAY